MTGPDDPFDEDEVNNIIGSQMAGQTHDALVGAQEEVDNAVRAVHILTSKLCEVLPPAAVVNLIVSMAVGTALSGMWGSDG